jgi:hypothetical protein
MPTFSVDVSQVRTRRDELPHGAYPAKILKAELTVSTKGDPMIVLDLELNHPAFGSVEVRDWIPATYPSKAKALFLAVNGYDTAEGAAVIASNPNIEFDPQELVGAELIIQWGLEKGRNGKEDFIGVVSPFYFPATRYDLLAWMEDAPL